MESVEEQVKLKDLAKIPLDWGFCLLSEAVNFLDGQRRPIKSNDREKINGEYPYYGASGIIDYVNDFIFDDDLILLGEDGENILSRNLPLAFKVSGKIWVNNHAHVLKPKTEFNIQYLTYYLESLDYKMLNSGTAQPKLNKQACANIKVLKPTRAEQTAIATALSDADNYIQSLENLHAKKRLIKQGAMQELLKPKEGWVVKKLGEIAIISKGEQLNRSGLNENDLYPVINGGILPSGYTDKFNQVEDTITISEGGNSCGFVNIIKTKFWQGGHCYSLETKIHKAYLFHFLKSRELEIMALRVGSGLPNIQRNRLIEYNLFMPHADEQAHIALILSDMDAEMESLDMQLTKARQIKHGMMQQLLTGKIRLV